MVLRSHHANVQYFLALDKCSETWVFHNTNFLIIFNGSITLGSDVVLPIHFFCYLTCRLMVLGMDRTFFYWLQCSLNCYAESMGNMKFLLSNIPFLIILSFPYGYGIWEGVDSWMTLKCCQLPWFDWFTFPNWQKEQWVCYLAPCLSLFRPKISVLH